MNSLINLLTLLATIIAVSGFFITQILFKDHPRKNQIQLFAVVVLFLGLGRFVLDNSVNGDKNVVSAPLQTEREMDELPKDKVRPDSTIYPGSDSNGQGKPLEPMKEYPEASEPDRSQAELLGEWRGDMIRPGLSDNATIVIFRENLDGKLEGSIEHPEINCHGDLFLLERNGNEFLFSQRKTRGGSNCGSGRTKIIITGEGKITRIWYSPRTGREASRGELYRVRSPF